MKPRTLGQLKEVVKTGRPFRSVKDEMRHNLIHKLSSGEDLFPGVIGYQESVIPSIVNALLSRHNLILLGLRGQAKSRILRGFAGFLDEELAVIEGCEINDDPFHPICGTCRRRITEEGDDLKITYLGREDRFVEKLATPDVTIADMVGDLDPIKAARHGRRLSDQENIHFGLIPRSHRGIFAINELPDLAPKIQVALFNIMQEGDVQIKGYPIRLPLDILLVFSANPEDYTARGKIVTPLKDRIGSEIRTHYPDLLEHGIEITTLEAWTERGTARAAGKAAAEIPGFIREIVEQIAFEGRSDKRVDKRSGVSQRLPISCLENCVSNAERRTLLTGEEKAVVRVSDIYSAIPAITGKLELEYEGELRGGDRVARDLITAAVQRIFRRHYEELDFEQVIQWFELGGEVKVSDMTPAAEYLEAVQGIQGLQKLVLSADSRAAKNDDLAASLVEFVLEGLYAQKRLSRNEEKGYFKERQKPDEEYFGDLKKRKGSFN